LPASQFRSATMIVNAQSRRGQEVFEQACSGSATCPFRSMRMPSRIRPARADTEARARGPADLVILAAATDGQRTGRFRQGHRRGIGRCCRSAPHSFARSLGISLDIAGAVDVIATGELRRIDLGMIDGDYFANCAAIGLSPQIAETVPPQLKRWFGPPAISPGGVRVHPLPPLHPDRRRGGGRQAAARRRGADRQWPLPWRHRADRQKPASIAGEIVVQAVRGHAAAGCWRNGSTTSSGATRGTRTR